MPTETAEIRAARFLLRRDEGDWSPADQAELDAWLAESLAHKAAYWRLEEGWRLTDRLRALYDPVVMLQPARRKWRSFAPFALAASLVLALVGFAMWPSPQPAEIVDLETHIGERRTAHLADGSMIELNTNTKLRLSFEQERRVAWVSGGEAYFQIAHDPSRPFVIHAGAHDVTVLGTKFSVRREGELLRVAVLQGAVQLKGVGRSSALGSTVLPSGSTAVAIGMATIVMREPLDKLNQSLRWRDGVLVLDGKTLGQAVAELNRYTRRPIVVKGDRLAAMPIGGTFQLGNREGFVRLLSQVYDVRVSRDADGKIFLQR
ncbi:FecR domain-containing protein [Sphingobium sp. AN558]|uniref:FecR family protein n=1 Tax=Sphingobium sp. AN558 TaxID=3133442 RepID=UPI0030C621B6